MNKEFQGRLSSYGLGQAIIRVFCLCCNVAAVLSMGKNDVDAAERVDALGVGGGLLFD